MVSLRSHALTRCGRWEGSDLDHRRRPRPRRAHIDGRLGKATFPQRSRFENAKQSRAARAFDAATTFAGSEALFATSTIGRHGNDEHSVDARIDRISRGGRAASTRGSEQKKGKRQEADPRHREAFHRCEGTGAREDTEVSRQFSAFPDPLKEKTGEG